jgi:glycerophosphoryl diester phosphodiesterase
VVRGEQVTCFLDGAQVIESPFCVDRQRGCVGLAVSGCRARFDDFTVRRLPDTPVPALRAGAAARTLCIAHRGFSAENTLAAVQAAMQAGADGCEFDVYTSRDGVAVLMHDATVNRTTNGKGKVSDLTVAELAKLDAGSWKGKAFAGEPVPTLVGVLEAMKGKGCTAIVEVKADGIAGAVVQAIRDAGMVEGSAVISFKEKALADIRALEPRLRCALLVGGKRKGTEAEWVAHLAERARECGAAILDLHYGMLSPTLIADLHRRGFKVWCWTVNDLPILDALARWGVGGITTDRPDVMIQWRRDIVR